MPDHSKYEMTPSLIIKILQGEQLAIAYYEKLLTFTVDTQDIETIQKIIDDETRHLNDLFNLFFGMTTQHPLMTKMTDPPISGYLDGIKNSIASALTTYEFYCNIYLECDHTAQKKLFFAMLTDENKNAQRLQFIYARSLERLCWMEKDAPNVPKLAAV